MINIKEIEKKSMSEKKRRDAKKDIFAFYVGRPLSYILTIPFLYTNIKPNTISLISIIPLLLSFISFSLGNNKFIYLLGWMLLFFWNLLDGVDGNIARYKGISSDMGSVVDALSGYIAMVSVYFSVGVAASSTNSLYIILGALSGIFVIFPRLIMHKAINTLGIVNEKEVNVSISKLIAINMTSITGFTQPLLLISIIFGLLKEYTITYFIINLGVMIISIYRIINNRGKV